LTANAEYLSANSAHESAADKRVKHAETSMSNDQYIKLAGKNKEEGNELFKHGTITDAMNRYMRAINLLAKVNKSTITSEERAQMDSIQLSTNLNMAQCVVRLTAAPGLTQEERDGLLKRGIASADAALAIEPSNPKAKYRKAVCLDRMKETEQAKKVIDEALRQNPDDSDLKALYDSLVASLKEQQSKAKKFFSKMFQ
jgi:tetratricopeptide (TPR) repeat protein